MENSLGLDMHGTTDGESEVQTGDSMQSTAFSPVQEVDDIWGESQYEEPSSLKQEDKNKKDKGKPYIPATPVVRAKMTPEELAERMEKIRLQNEKIKERREHVKADEEAFNTSVAADRAKQAAYRRVQAQINQNREQNAKRKLEKMGNREWDSGKQDGEWKQGKRPTEDNGRGDFFSTGPEIGSSRTSKNRKAVSGSSRDAAEPAESSSHPATPLATKSPTTLSQSDPQTSEKWGL